jgi:hypothetical protein
MVLRFPIEIFERILANCALEDVSACSQTCLSVRTLIYGPNTQHLWRALYLRDFDDPRLRNPPAVEATVSPTFGPDAPPTIPFDRRFTLQRITRARRLITSPDAANVNVQDRFDAFQTLINVALSAAPLDHSQPLKYSANTKWLAGVLQGSGSGVVLDEKFIPGHYFPNELVTSLMVPPVSLVDRPDIAQLFKLQCILGISSEQFPAINRVALCRAARLYCYNDENFHYLRPNQRGRLVKDWGPYLNGGIVDWRAMFYAMVIGESEPYAPSPSG